MKNNISRRYFIKASSLATTGVFLGSTAFSAKSYSRILGANDRINFAIVGLRSRAQAHRDALKFCSNVNVSHICDVDKRYFPEFSQKVKDQFGGIPQEIIDFRKLVEIKEIDAVTIATPEHWHAPMSIMSVQNGKHVYVEKPSSHNPREGELINEAVAKYGKLIQMGNQQRSSDHTIEIISRIHQGLIGTPYFGKAWYSNKREGIGIGNVVPVPDYLDWELWQGPAPRTEYRDNIHPYNWHWFWNWGTGETLNNGTHEVDICRWALGVDYPNLISASGGRYHYKDDWEFYDTLITSFQYDDKLIEWEGKSCNNLKYYDRDRGSIIQGTKGSVLIDRGGFIIFDLDGKVIETSEKQKATSSSDLIGMDIATINHFKNLVDGIRNNIPLKSPVVEGNISVTMLQLSNIAWKFGRTIQLDPKNAHILNDNEANSMWSREYEPGWEIKV
jgi:predicted dehydrogenase